MAASERVSGGLRAWSAAGLSLETALALVDRSLGLEGAVAMLYGPARFGFQRFEGGRLRGAEPVARVFEARVFTPEVELRWLAESGGGRASVLHERPGSPPDGPWTERSFGGQVIARMTVSHLLWGTFVADRDGLPDGWCWLAEARIGRMAVPHPGGSERLAIAATEYVAADDEHGNAHVVAERLLRIEPARTEEDA